MSKHTPGPWKVEFSEYKEHEIFNESGQMSIAQVYLFDADEATRSNAELIAKAPDLLKENERLNDTLSEWDEDILELKGKNQFLENKLERTIIELHTCYEKNNELYQHIRKIESIKRERIDSLHEESIERYLTERDYPEFMKITRDNLVRLMQVWANDYFNKK